MREKRFRADDDGALELSGLQEVVGDGQGVDETRSRPPARRTQRPCVMPRPAWIARAVAGKGAIGRGGGANDEVDVDRIDAGAHQCLARGGDAEIGGQLAVLGDVALLDAGAFA